MTQQPRTPTTLMLRADLSREDFAAIGIHVRAAQAEARADLLAQIEKAVLDVIVLLEITDPNKAVATRFDALDRLRRIAAIRSVAPVEPTYSDLIRADEPVYYSGDDPAWAAAPVEPES